MFEVKNSTRRSRAAIAARQYQRALDDFLVVQFAAEMDENEGHEEVLRAELTLSEKNKPPDGLTTILILKPRGR